MGGFRSSPTELTQCWDIKQMSGGYHSTYNVAYLAIELNERDTVLRYEGEAKPEPEYTPDYQQRKPFVPNNSYRPYARTK